MKNLFKNLFPASLILIFTMLSLHSFSQSNGSWIQKNDFGGVARSGAASFSLNGKGYVGTGYYGGSSRKKDFWEYDPSTDAWSQKMDFGGTARYYSKGFSILDKGYFACGNDGLDTVVGGTTKDIWEYDPIGNTWTQKTPFPGMARMAAVGFSIGSKGYFGTGEHIKFPGGVQTVTRINDFWEFDPNAGTDGKGIWTEKAKINNDVNLVRAFAAGFSIGNKGYIGTGHNALHSMYNDFWEYDPSADTWTRKADFIDSRWEAVGINIGGFGYVGLGDNGSGGSTSSYLSDFYQYNPVADTWVKLASFGGTGRIVAAAFSTGTKVYIGTGLAYVSTHTKDFWEFTPSANWSGATSSDWDVSSNWLGGVVPDAVTNTTIPNTTNHPVIGSAAKCNDLTINSNAVLTITAGKSLKVNGILTNNAGTAGLVIKSNATGTGSLIHNTAGVNATAERYIAAANWTNSDNGWHLLSSPVTSQAIAGAWTPPGTNNNDYDFYALSEATTKDCWLDQKISANNITNFIPGTGYYVAYQEAVASPRTFTGTLTTADVTLTGLTHTAGSAYAGFHLAGNPFSSALDWNTGSWAKTNLDANAYVWESNNGDYTSTAVAGKNIIPSMNAFMVRVNTTAGGTLKIPADSRLADATNWYKSNEDEIILLKANDLVGGLSQSSIVRFNPQATTDFDTEFDSYFISGFAPKFYSVTSGSNLLLNTLPTLPVNQPIPFTFIKNNAENFSIELAKSLTNVSVYLEDLKMDSIQNLTKNPVYNFTSSEGDDPARFNLQFQDFTSVKTNKSQGTFGIYQRSGTISITTPQATDTDILISNMLGQVVLRAKTNHNLITTLNAGTLQNGVYIVSLKGNKSLISKKMVVSR